MVRTGVKWRLVAGFTAAVCLGSAAAAYSQFTSFNDRTRAVLQGHWQSCREDDGQYAERVYDGNLPGFGPFELHMGPYHEFALFRGVQDEHRSHGSDKNLLQPYNVEVAGAFGKHKWEAAGLQLEVVLAGGSREDCESWVVMLTRAASSSSH
jgi:hypothetical protein